jgi:integrase/recombinase XerC
LAGVPESQAPPQDAATDEGHLAEAMVRVLAEYERHLVSERDLAPHTVRAYLSDVAGLLDHAGRLGATDAGALDLRTLRGWLARTGRIPVDVGASLRSPKPHQALPPVLRQDEARELIDAATRLADDGSPTGLRDVAMLELLYATGVRVGELVGLDVDDVDRSRT